jgi:LysM repeat protein
MAEANCHYCDRAAEAECPTCGRLYCREHGEDVCLRCLAPEAAAPTAIAYRGAVLALVVGSVVTLFLVIRPPESKSANDTPRELATATTSFLSTATPTRQGGDASRTTVATATAGAQPTGAATAAGTVRTYTVRDGDSLSVIAEQFNTTVDAIMALNPGLTPETLQIGAVLQIPAAR